MARLERLLIEHLDLRTNRLDARRQGMFQLQLEFMRHRLAAQAGPAIEAEAVQRARDAGQGSLSGRLRLAGGCPPALQRAHPGAGSRRRA